MDWLAAHLDDPTIRIVDSRYYFDGRDGRAEYQRGHIPGAVHVDWSTDLADIKATPHSAFSLTLIGYPHVRLYDGSWAESGGSPHRPIETGDPFLSFLLISPSEPLP